MADEIQITIQRSLRNGSLVDAPQPTTQVLDQTSPGRWGGTFSIGTSEEDLAPSADIANLGWMFIKNLDPTNFVTWGPKSGTMVPLGRIYPGEEIAVRLAPTGVTVTLDADTAPCEVEVTIWEA